MTIAERSLAEMYFDPGMRGLPINYDTLAKSWRLHKIKTVYAAGWYYDDKVMDYSQLVKACHENGILIYCWMEPPMISDKFWADHPDWREKTAKSLDAHVDLAIPDEPCRHLMPE